MTAPTATLAPFTARLRDAAEDTANLYTRAATAEAAGIVAALAKDAETEAKGARTPLVKALGAAAVTLARAGNEQPDLPRGITLASRYLRDALEALEAQP